MQVVERDYGTHIIDHRIEILFGNKNFGREDFPKLESAKNFFSLEQIHSDICLEAKHGHEQKADAHYSFDKNIALIIKTADCVPIMMYCSTTDTILAIHAGWRGLRDNIITKSIKAAFPHSKITNIKVFVGPHIAAKNYEFSKSDIMELKSAGFVENFYLELGESLYLDLNAIYMGQFLQAGLTASNIHLFNQDTYEGTNYHSYRRDQTKGRLYHLIVRKS